jgi:(E)-4-hydroxy-3-methylbut-2-enyl-diphosphate synthase
LTPAGRIQFGGDELIRVVVRQANFDKIAHKIDKMGDYKPEIVYEKAQIKELDPRDEIAIAELNQNSTAQLVTIRDGVDLPVIAAFRLLAARLHPRHPIVLKDELGRKKDEKDFLETLLIASTNIGSLLCDGIGDAILVQGEEAPGRHCG